MQKFTESLWFVIAFLFVSALLRAFMGERATLWFLLLVLLGMLTVNASKLNKLLSFFTKGA